MSKPSKRNSRTFTIQDLPFPGDIIDFGEGEKGTVLHLIGHVSVSGIVKDPSGKPKAHVCHRNVSITLEVFRSPITEIEPDFPESVPFEYSTDAVDEIGLPLSIDQSMDSREE